MKRLIVYYIISAIFFIYIFGNMNFFGVQEFRMDIDTLENILWTWAPLGAIFLYAISDKSEKK